MAIDKLSQINILPPINREKILSGGLPEVVDYVVKLVNALQEGALRDLMMVVNNQLFLTDEGVFAFDLPDADGNYKEGDHRFIKVDEGIELQIYNSGAWQGGTDAIARWTF